MAKTKMKKKPTILIYPLTLILGSFLIAFSFWLFSKFNFFIGIENSKLSNFFPFMFSYLSVLFGIIFIFTSFKKKKTERNKL